MTRPLAAALALVCIACSPPPSTASEPHVGMDPLAEPADGSGWAVTAPMPLTSYSHTATLLPDGRVLVVGGVTSSQHVTLARAQLYDPATATWTATQPLAQARSHHTATLLPDGKVLVAGGTFGSVAPLTSAELYDPATGAWTPTGALHQGRYIHRAVLVAS